MPGEKIDDEIPTMIKGECPFCELEVVINVQKFAVFHQMPPCKTYIDADDALEFVILMRKKQEADRGG